MTEPILTEEDIEYWYHKEIDLDKGVTYCPGLKFNNLKDVSAEQLKQQILKNQKLADERREQLELEKTPNIQKFTYSYYELQKLPEWKEKAEKWDALDKELWNNPLNSNYRENKQLKEKLEKIDKILKKNNDFHSGIIVNEIREILGDDKQ
jgi:hypothetical protein